MRACCDAGSRTHERVVCRESDACDSREACARKPLFPRVSSCAENPLFVFPIQGAVALVQMNDVSDDEAADVKMSKAKMVDVPLEDAKSVQSAEEPFVPSHGLTSDGVRCCCLLQAFFFFWRLPFLPRIVMGASDPLGRFFRVPRWGWFVLWRSARTRTHAHTWHYLSLARQ